MAEPRKLLLKVHCGDWCEQCQFLDMVGVPDEKNRVPHCRLFAQRLRRVAPNSMGALRLGECVAAENLAFSEANQ